MSRRILLLREDVNWCVSAHVSDMNNTTTLTRRQRVYTLGKCMCHAVNEGSVLQMWKTNPRESRSQCWKNERKMIRQLCAALEICQSVPIHTITTIAARTPVTNTFPHAFAPSVRCESRTVIFRLQLTLRHCSRTDSINHLGLMPSARVSFITSHLLRQQVDLEHPEHGLHHAFLAGFATPSNCQSFFKLRLLLRDFIFQHHSIDLDRRVRNHRDGHAILVVLLPDITPALFAMTSNVSNLIRVPQLASNRTDLDPPRFVPSVRDFLYVTGQCVKTLKTIWVSDVGQIPHVCVNHIDIVSLAHIDVTPRMSSTVNFSSSVHVTHLLMA